MENRDNGLGTDHDGNVYVSWFYGSVIRVFRQSVSAFGQPGHSAGEFMCPGGLWIDSYNRLFVADSGNGRVQQGSFSAHPARGLPGHRRAGLSRGTVTRAGSLRRRVDCERLAIRASRARPDVATARCLRGHIFRHRRRVDQSTEYTGLSPRVAGNPIACDRGKVHRMDGNREAVSIPSHDCNSRRRRADANRRILVHPRPRSALKRAGSRVILFGNAGCRAAFDSGQRCPGRWGRKGLASCF